MVTRKAIKYRVTGPFGLRAVGDIIDAYLIIEDSDSGNALIYHPSSYHHAECGSIEFGKLAKDGVYVARSYSNYINLTRANEALFKKLPIKIK